MRVLIRYEDKIMKYFGEDIYNIIPNRYPLMILDSLDIIENKAIGVIDLKSDNWFFDCHYPGNPIFPLCLLLESVTQTFSAIFLANNVINEIPVISSISEIKLKEASFPGDHLRIEAVLKSFRRGIAKGSCRVFKNGSEDPILEIDIVDVIPSQMVRML